MLCHLAFNAPLRTRRERAQRLRQDRKDFFDRYGPEARQILDELLEKYAEHGDAQFVLPDVLHVPPISHHGQPGEIIRLFGGPDQLRQAVTDLQVMLYASLKRRKCAEQRQRRPRRRSGASSSPRATSCARTRG